MTVVILEQNACVNTRLFVLVDKHGILYQLIPPPPTPAIARVITNAHKLVAIPQRRDPMKKTQLANNNADLRPNTSEIRPSIILLV